MVKLLLSQNSHSTLIFSLKSAFARRVLQLLAVLIFVFAEKGIHAQTVVWAMGFEATDGITSLTGTGSTCSNDRNLSNTPCIATNWLTGGTTTGQKASWVGTGQTAHVECAGTYGTKLTESKTGWLISQGAALTTGVTYHVTFRLRSLRVVSGTSSNTNVKLEFGTTTTQTTLPSVTQIANENATTTGAISYIVYSFTVPSTATYYLCFKGTTASNAIIAIDNMKLTYGSAAPSTSATPTLTYSTPTASYCTSSAITANTPSFNSTAIPSSYSITPALPAGLSFNTSTGAITGTPTASSAATNYTITMNTPCSSVSYTSVVNITVNAAPVAGTISGGSSICNGQSVTYTASAVAGTTVAYSILGGTGATINSSTGAISNVTGNYTVVATYTSTSGCGTATAQQAVTLNSVSTSAVNALVSPSVSNNDYLWNGTTSTDWGTAGNWYVYNSSTTPNFSVASSVPATTTNVYILPSSVTCIGSNIPSVAASSNANHVYIGTGATLNGSTQTLNVYGNWTNNGTFNRQTGTLNFTGTTDASVAGSGGNNFHNMTVNKTGGAKITLGSAVSAINALTMTSGNIITTSSFLLTVGSAAATPGTLNWTDGTVVGPIKRWYTNAAQSGTLAEGIFPVGVAAHNRYARVNFASNPGGGFITAEYKAGVCPIGYNGLFATINGQGINNYCNEGWWEITPNGGNLNTTSYSLVLRGKSLTTVNDLTKLRIIKSTGHSAWNDNVAGDGTHEGTEAGSTLADFTLKNSAMLGFSWFDIGSDNANPLPVALTNFSASCGNQSQAELRWTTESEQSSLKFVVEKSRELVNWILVGETPAAGNSNQQIEYSLTDYSPFADITYYRLLQVDVNGDEKVFGPVSIPCSGDMNHIEVFPNPSNGEFTVSITSDFDDPDAVLQVIDSQGKLVKVLDCNLKQGTNSIPVVTSVYSSGLYFVRLVSTGTFYGNVRLVIEL